MSETDEKTWTNEELIEYARGWNPRTGFEQHPLNILCTRLEASDAKLGELWKIVNRFLGLNPADQHYAAMTTVRAIAHILGVNSETAREGGDE